MDESKKDQVKKTTTVGSYGRVTQPELKYTPKTPSTSTTSGNTDKPSVRTDKPTSKKKEKNVLERNVDYFETVDASEDDAMDSILDALAESLEYIHGRLEALDKKFEELDAKAAGRKEPPTNA